MTRVFMLFKEMSLVKKINVKLKIGITLVLASVIFTGAVLANYSDSVSKGLADNLIRLHVIANSDSAADQALKRDVRDLVLEYMKVNLKDSKDIEQTKYLINSNRLDIEKIAENEIRRQGKDYSVRVMLGNYPFPTKMYGDIILPAGNYQALRVVIGKGEGANWWCVLFPPLCFVDATHGTVPDSVKKDLKKNLSKEEYRIITTTDNDEDIPVKIKFKVVEFFQNSRSKLSKFFSDLF